MIGRRSLPCAPHNRVVARALTRGGILGGALAACAIALSSCGNTLQDQPIGSAPLESVMVSSHFPVYWLGLGFRGMLITNVSIDPGGAVTIRYGDCVLGGQYTCVTPVSIVSSPDNSFVPSAGPATPKASVRGVAASLAQGGATLAIATGGVVVSVYGRTPELAHMAATMMVPLNTVGLPQTPLPPALPDTGLDRIPLPSQVPGGLSLPRPRGA